MNFKFQISNFKLKWNSAQRGFTLIELMVVIGILGILIALVSVNLSKVQTGASVVSKTAEVAAEMRGQQGKAMAGDAENTGGSIAYGIHFDADKYVLFRGTVYNASETSNVVFTNESGVTFTNILFPGGDLVFDKVSGEVVGYTAGQDAVTVVHTASSDQKTITVNKYGVITQVQ
jgi:prepilin-type N-terminal cleavage/methylation domain-containing protein